MAFAVNECSMQLAECVALSMVVWMIKQTTSAVSATVGAIKRTDEHHDRACPFMCSCIACADDDEKGQCGQR